MDVTATNLTNAATTQSTTNSALSADFETFLTMLTVQMENQDPLNPVDSSDYAVQLATFSGVEQQVQTNDLLAEIRSMFGTSGLVQLADWVGKEVRVTASGHYDGAPISGAYSIPTTADSAELVVQDENGQEVDRQQLALGTQDFVWGGGADGQPTGRYTFYVVSSSAGDVIETEQAQVYSTVTEVQTQDGSNVLILAGGQTVAATAVTAVRD